MKAARPKRSPKLGIVRAVTAATQRGRDTWRLDIYSRKAQAALYHTIESPSHADDRVAQTFRLHRSKGHTVRLSAELATIMADGRGAPHTATRDARPRRQGELPSDRRRA